MIKILGILFNHELLEFNEFLIYILSNFSNLKMMAFLFVKYLNKI